MRRKRREEARRGSEGGSTEDKTLRETNVHRGKNTGDTESTQEGMEIRYKTPQDTEVPVVLSKVLILKSISILNVLNGCFIHFL